MIEDSKDLFQAWELRHPIYTTITCSGCGKEYIVKKAERDQVAGCPFCAA